jgi:NADH-quinone oxidoreductase subunit L
LCSGSVIHAVHSNEMTDMGGLLKKMPITAMTMLVGCLAIIGAGIPLSTIGFSGYYSKDAILEQAWSFASVNPIHNTLFIVPAAGAAITAFYMFRMWYMTFLGKPRDQHRYDHAHESPRVMTTPLIVLALFALAVAWPVFGLSGLIESARPAGTLATADGGVLMPNLIVPNEHLGHVDAVRVPAGLIAFGTALSGLLLASAIYWWGLINPAEIRRQFRAAHRFLVGKWWFDELYEAIFIQPTLFVSRCISGIDKRIIDFLIDGLAMVTRKVANVWDAVVDQRIVDGLFNGVAHRTWDVALALRVIQTGKLRQYVMFIVIGTVALFVLVSIVRSYALAG